MNDLQAAYLTMQNACGIKVGDKVKVLRKAEDNEMGWKNNWSESMNKYINDDIYSVAHINELGIHLDTYRAFPFFVLEKIESASTEEMMICKMAKECDYKKCSHMSNHKRNAECMGYCFEKDREVKCIPITEKPIDPILKFIDDEWKKPSYGIFEIYRKAFEMLLERINKCTQ